MVEFDWLSSPSRLWTRPEILSDPCPVPKVRGIYGWYFKEIPGSVPTTSCICHNEMTLLYVGICPGKAKGNKPLSNRRTIFDRIKEHAKGNAEGSTLRETLGVLLAEKTGFPLRCIMSKKNPNKPKKDQRVTLTNQGEQTLDRWLNDNAFVVWNQLEEPWLLEESLLNSISLPLNLDGNKHHPFHETLSRLRKEARLKARELPSVSDTVPRS